VPDAIPGVPELLSGFCELDWRAIILEDKEIPQGGRQASKEDSPDQF